MLAVCNLAHLQVVWAVGIMTCLPAAVAFLHFYWFILVVNCKCYET